MIWNFPSYQENRRRLFPLHNADERKVDLSNSPLLMLHCCLLRYRIPLDLWPLIVAYIFEVFDNKTLRLAVNRWCNNEPAATRQFGHISDWNTSHVTDMSKLFYKRDEFNDNIDQWDVSNVIDMSDLFANANSFNQPLNSWNVCNVIDMSGMFHDAVRFNRPLDRWNTENVTNMRDMFNGATEFNQILDNWNVDNVVNMTRIFIGARSFSYLKNVRLEWVLR